MIKNQLIKNWQELSEVEPNDKYKIEIDLDMCNGWIVPIEETVETEKNYFKHHCYLSTHTFYRESHKYYTQKLQEFGFNIEIVTSEKYE